MAADAGLIEINVRAKLDQLDKDMNAARTKAVNAADAMGEEMATKMGSRFSGLGAKISEQLTPARLAAGGAAIGGVGIALTKMGDDSKMATAQLTTAIDNAGGSMSELEPHIDSVSKRMIQLGHDDEAAARAMATLTTATQDPGKAMDSMGLAADIAAAKHISLEAAAGQLAKMYSGNTRIFKEFGITLGANASAEEKAAAMTELTSRVQGQAAAQADNLSTKVKAARIGLENIAESVGSTVGPAFAVLGPMIGGFGAILQTGLVGKLGGAIAGLARFGGAMIGTGIMAAQAAIPVIIAWAPVILAIAAVIAIGVLLWKNWDTIKAAASAAWGWISNAVGTAVSAVSGFLTALIGGIVNFVQEWGILLLGPIGAIWKFRDQIGEGLGKVVEFFLGLPAKIFGALASLANTLWDTAWEAMTRMSVAFVDKAAEIISWFGELPGRVFGALADLAGRLWDVAWEAMVQMSVAFVDKAAEIISWFTELPGKILGALGDVGRMLWDAGWKIMLGLKDGIVAGLGAVKDFVTGIAGKIISWKGPLDYDKKMLIPAGRAIMDSLVVGLRDHERLLVRQIAHVTGMVEGVGATDLLASAAGSYGASLSVSGLGHTGDGGDSGASSSSGTRSPINVGPFYVKENDLPTEIPRRLRGALHLWGG